MGFEELVKPLIEYLRDNHHPHTVVIIDSDHAEVFEGVKVISREKKDVR